MTSASAIDPPSGVQVLIQSLADPTTTKTSVQNAAPVVVTSSGPTFVDARASGLIDDRLSVSDSDSRTLASATVTISGNYRKGQDVLALSATSESTGNIVATFDPDAGVLKLTSNNAAATVAQFKAALEAVTYTNTLLLPDTSDRTISFAANDWTAASNIATKIVKVAGPPIYVPPEPPPVSNAGPNGNAALFGAFATDTTSPGGKVHALYETILGHEADPLGMEFWAGKVRDGTPLKTVADALLASPEFTALGRTSPESFVAGLYKFGLHRPADTAGSSSWVTALKQGASPAQVAADFALSRESKAALVTDFSVGVFVPDPSAADVARLYYGVLGRAPDAVGLAAYDKAVEGGASLTSIAQTMMASSEYAKGHAGQSLQAFVESVYMSALGRPADAAGLAGWTKALASGTSQAQVAVAISESAEAQIKLVGHIETNWTLA